MDSEPNSPDFKPWLGFSVVSLGKTCFSHLFLHFSSQVNEWVLSDIFNSRVYPAMDLSSILFLSPEAVAFGQHQESRTLASPNF